MYPCPFRCHIYTLYSPCRFLLVWWLWGVFLRLTLYFLNLALSVLFFYFQSPNITISLCSSLFKDKKETDWVHSSITIFCTRLSIFPASSTVPSSWGAITLTLWEKQDEHAPHRPKVPLYPGQIRSCLTSQGQEQLTHEICCRVASILSTGLYFHMVYG